MQKIPIKVKNLLGMRFGKIVVIEFVGTLKTKWGSVAIWKYRCDCGTIKTGRSFDIQIATSCGCSRNETLRKLFTTHGETRNKKPTAEYKIWCGIISRCENPKVKIYKDYGERGISMCRKWRHSFKAFLSDMGRMPSPGHSIERINNNKGYSPNNCVWIFRSRQVCNTRCSKWLTYNGEKMILADWARKTQIPYKTLWNRLQAGWTVKRTLSTPRCI